MSKPADIILKIAKVEEQDEDTKSPSFLETNSMSFSISQSHVYLFLLENAIRKETIA